VSGAREVSRPDRPGRRLATRLITDATEQDHLHVARPLRQHPEQQIVGDLISYQNDGKCSAAIVGKVGRA
jgi:hypothetical protein